MADLAALGAAFVARYGSRPRFFRAPGRLNVIGEHTDYCDGLAMPAAIDRACIVAAAPNGTQRIRAVTLGSGAAFEADLGALTPHGDWRDYVAGVAAMMRADGCALVGADLMIWSDVPVGAGLSSSAAVEVSTALALLALAGIDAKPLQVALWAQAAENRFVGMPCGLMDQFASLHGVEDAALLLDCRTRRAEAIPLPRSVSFLIVNSMEKHALVGGEYAERRADCEAAAAHFGAAALRDVSAEHLARATGAMPERIARRARHVVSEIARVTEAATAIRASDFKHLGQLMDASHESLSRDMEVSTPALDDLAAIARATPGVYGARMMGGGFGGCVIALAETGLAEAVIASIAAHYGARRGVTADAFICRPAAGASEVVHA